MTEARVDHIAIQEGPGLVIIGELVGLATKWIGDTVEVRTRAQADAIADACDRAFGPREPRQPER